MGRLFTRARQGCRARKERSVWADTSHFNAEGPSTTPTSSQTTSQTPYILGDLSVLHSAHSIVHSCHAQLFNALATTSSALRDSTPSSCDVNELRNMATPKSGGQNGASNGVNPKAVAPQPSAAPRVFSRPFEVLEALPYSPFTSIIPFEPGQ